MDSDVRPSRFAALPILALSTTLVYLYLALRYGWEMTPLPTILALFPAALGIVGWFQARRFGIFQVPVAWRLGSGVVALGLLIWQGLALVNAAPEETNTIVAAATAAHPREATVDERVETLKFERAGEVGRGGRSERGSESGKRKGAQDGVPSPSTAACAIR